MGRLYFILALGLFSCNNMAKQLEPKQLVDTTIKVEKRNKIDNSKYYTTKDTFNISTELGDTLRYAKAEFNMIVDKHAEFFKEYPQNPDLEYYNNNDKDDFNSEVGQDTYFALYAYFLKQKNGIERYALERKKLIDIYSNINSLFEFLQNGGTYFGHQGVRILGYAEYSIYLLPKNKGDIEKTYEITKQKELYIKSLRQLIIDETKIDSYSLDKNRTEKYKKLNKFVDELNKLITDNFYLKRAQEFQYGYYEFY